MRHKRITSTQFPGAIFIPKNSIQSKRQSIFYSVFFSAYYQHKIKQKGELIKMAKVNVVWKGMYVGTEKMSTDQIRKAEYAGFTITYAE